MTLPVYTPTPFETDGSNADAEEGFGAVATTTDANFAKVNTYMTTRQDPVFVRSYATGSFYNYSMPASTWFTIPAGSFPPLNIVIPTRPAGLLVTLGATMYHNVGDNYYFFAASFQLSGGTTAVVDHNEVRLIAGRSTICSSVSFFAPPNTLTPGGTVTVTPIALHNGAAGNYGTEVQLAWGELHAVALL